MLTLAVPFIAICILSVLIDKFTMFIEGIFKKIDFGPDAFEGVLAYLLVFSVGFIVCWRGSFDFFIYLDFTFRNPWEGWVLTSLLLSGGSKFVRESFGVMSDIPQIISNVYSTATSFFSGGSTYKENTTAQVDKDLKGPL